MEYTFTKDQIPEIAMKVLSEIKTKIVLFYGEMGTGKTTLIKEIAKQLGVNEVMSSPTFSIVNEYKLNEGKLFHFDFYRIENKEEAYDIGIEEYFYSGFWNLIEWPEKIENLLPEKSTNIKLTNNKNGSRTIMIKPMN
ncbi:tRNA (adenosine(37)-N6)-threonylcarbamoyltransferase complex ATPase subunit type 1 TsaE [Candidatus Marifrigoribacter sp. Uisw_064]|jgi:tRNA threonylcarbamoyladenosine biosynthesis protein TsaE|uniref:tRNA (adenosine(37)-N6)-threonylcarbamoyltransferase complex ATPase subunit type 1 TsaE n=1 Tax=Candidatus Marifrigoribacter sp. Uisw_064 TaxID=3230970 RepID=UPI003D44EE1D